MRGILPFLMLCMFATLSFSQSQRIILFEEFTQASCPPCEINKPFVNEIIGANIDKLVQIRYQTSWPGVDPMNADNPSDVAARVSYYSIVGVPTVLVDGVSPERVGDYILPQSSIDARTSVSSAVKIEVDHSLSADLSTFNVTVKIINEGEFIYDLESDRLRVALIEREIVWPFRPGSTSMQDFPAVMKRFVGSVEGMVVPSIAPGEEFVMEWNEVAMPQRVYDFRELAVVAFVQDEESKRVINASMSDPKEIADYADVNIFTIDVPNSGLCDLNLESSVSIRNSGNIPSGPFRVELLVNGQVLDSQTESESLEPSEGRTYNFTGQLQGGGNSVQYRIIPDFFDPALLNNFSNILSLAKISDTEKIEYSFEANNLGATPAGTIVNRPFSANNFIVTNNTRLEVPQRIGGFGESDNSVIINFYQWGPTTQPQTGSMVFAEQQNVKAGAMINFDYAYTSWGGSNDRLQIQVSTNCGETYTTVWNQAGASLRTAPELNTDPGFFVPQTSQWRNIEIPLDDYVGEDIVIRVFVTSDWGDMLYIDNFTVETPSNVGDITFTGNVSIAPNPANHIANINFELTESADVSMRIFDMAGRLVQQEKIGNHINGMFTHSINTSIMNSGLYIVELTVGYALVQKKLVVSH
jgi:hypothetical protein